MKIKRNHAQGIFHHVVIKGVRELPIFHSYEDMTRFMSPMLLMQFDKFSQTRVRYSRINPFDISNNVLYKKITSEKRLVSLVDYNLLDTHVHLIVYSEQEYGLSHYMKRIMTSHSNWYNKKYKKQGHVFKSSYFSKHINSDSYFDVVTEYVQFNHRDYYKFDTTEEVYNYPFSSFYDRHHGNRWKKIFLT